MNAEELLYPPGTRVASWHIVDKDEGGRRRHWVYLRVLRVTDEGTYTLESDTPVGCDGIVMRAVDRATREIKRRGYVYDPYARPNVRVPCKSELLHPPGTIVARIDEDEFTEGIVTAIVMEVDGDGRYKEKMSLPFMCKCHANAIQAALDWIGSRGCILAPTARHGSAVPPLTEAVLNGLRKVSQ